MLTDNQRKETIYGFFKYLYKKIPKEAKKLKPYVVLDNLGSHKSSLITEYCQDKLELVFQPTYSCEFNSIETYWAYAKRRYKKQNLEERYRCHTE